jgi:hypothetical protein
LKRVAHNIDDYSMGHILRFAREAGIGTLTIDLLTVGIPGKSVEGALLWFARLVLENVP